MPKYCYTHKDKEAYRECARCYKSICFDCAKIYWKTNTISAMFSPQKDQKEKLHLCPRCLKTERIKNALVSGFLLVLVVGVIISGILFVAL